MKPRKKEEGDRDRFISYLRSTEKVNYVSIADDVKNRAGNKNFDYLLQADTRELLALEITWLTDKDETHNDRDQHHDFLEDDQKFQIMIAFLKSLTSKEKRPGSLVIRVPYYVPFTRKELNCLIENNVESIKSQLAVIQNCRWELAYL